MKNLELLEKRVTKLEAQVRELRGEPAEEETKDGKEGKEKDAGPKKTKTKT